MKIEIKTPVVAERYFPDRLPLPRGVDKLSSGSEAKCRDCGELLTDHGWIERVKKVCPGSWVINGRNVMTDKEFTAAYKQRPNDVNVKGPTPWN